MNPERPQAVGAVHYEDVVNEPTTESLVAEAELTQEDAISEYSGPDAAGRSHKEKKFVALFKARTIISMIGTMEERIAAKHKLKDMKKRGLASI